jgi:hypothetical protein
VRRLPPGASRILSDGVLCYLAVRVPGQPGPHLTPVVYALDGGRLWVTTARRSVKARAWRLDPEVAGMVTAATGTVTFRGVVRTYDALDPLSWPSAVAAGPRIVRAATRFSMKNARFFAGYAVDAPRVPMAWTPPGRVFAGIEMVAGCVVASGQIAERWGEWEAGVSFRTSFSARRRSGQPDLEVPDAVRRRLGIRGQGVVALDGGGPITVLPALWRRASLEGAYDAVVEPHLIGLAVAIGTARTGLTLDHASAWRAANMSGMLLQGPGELYARSATRRGAGSLASRLDDSPAGGAALVRVRPERVVWWQGWRSGTVKARHRPKPSPRLRATASGRPGAKPASTTGFGSPSDPRVTGGVQDR